MGSDEVKRPAIFLDRDGVLTSEAYYERTGEWEAPMYPEDLKILPGALEAAKKLSAAGYLLFLISNQAAFAKGKCRLEDIFAVQDRFMEEVRKAGLVFTDMYYSYTHPKGIVEDFSGPTFDRKPSPYFLKLAAARYGVDLAASWMIGDRDLDVECGKRAGTRTIRVFNKNAGENAGKIEPTFEAQNLPEAVEIILGKKPT
jgi:D-glycero-D-manno-heptose 1,7-bisphosphate phosphatase